MLCHLNYVQEGKPKRPAGVWIHARSSCKVIKAHGPWNTGPQEGGERHESHPFALNQFGWSPFFLKQECPMERTVSGGHQQLSRLKGIHISTLLVSNTRHHSCVTYVTHCIIIIPGSKLHYHPHFKIYMYIYLLIWKAQHGSSTWQVPGPWQPSLAAFLALSSFIGKMKILTPALLIQQIFTRPSPVNKRM